MNAKEREKLHKKSQNYHHEDKNSVLFASLPKSMNKDSHSRSRSHSHPHSHSHSHPHSHPHSRFHSPFLNDVPLKGSPIPSAQKQNSATFGLPLPPLHKIKNSVILGFPPKVQTQKNKEIKSPPKNNKKTGKGIKEIKEVKKNPEKNLNKNPKNKAGGKKKPETKRWR